MMNGMIMLFTKVSMFVSNVTNAELLPPKDPAVYAEEMSGNSIIPIGARI